MPFITATVFAAAALLAIAILARTALTAWNGWLDLQRTRLAGTGTISALGMIDLSDVKERLRKLEAIAAGVDI